MKTVLHSGLNVVKRTALIVAITTISCWTIPAFAELNINNSQSVTLSKNASESQYFTETIRLMKSTNEIKHFQNPRYDQQLVTDLNINVRKRYEDLGVVFLFGTVEGGFFGKVTGDLMLEVPVQGQSELFLRLPEHIDTKLVDIPFLTVDDFGIPIELARLSNSARLDDNSILSSEMNGAEIIDGLTKRPIMLVYSSGKVDITGTTYFEDDTEVYNVSLPFKGWHWIINKKIDDQYLVTRIDRTEIDPIIYAF